MTIAVHPDNGYTPTTNALQAPSQDQAIARLVEWAQAADGAYQLATKLCGTQFAPTAYRGKPEEATAAILAGAEVGLSPMASLRAFDNIQGTPAPKAITLRAIVQAHGHDIRIDESTGKVAAVSGRRKGSNEWQTCTWTIERAIQAKYPEKNPNWKTNPTAMLIARATAEVCRWIASDAIMGMPYAAEEIRDEDGTFEPRPPAVRVTAAEILGATTDPAEPAEEPEPPADSAPSAPEGNGAGMSAAHRGMFATFRDAAPFDEALGFKEGQLDFIADVIGRRIESRRELTDGEARLVTTRLRAFIAQSQPQDGGES